MLRFSIRDLLWLTLLAVVLVAWWTDRSRPNSDNQLMRGRTESLMEQVSLLTDQLSASPSYPPAPSEDSR